MKITLAAIAISICATSAQADILSEYCEVLADISGDVMELRQDGLPLRDLINAVGEDTLTAAIARSAYTQPRYETREGRMMAVEKFRDARVVACAQAGL